MISKKWARMGAPVLSIIVLAANFAQAGNLVSNGSFESSIFTANYELASKSFNPLGATDSGVSGWYNEANAGGGKTYNLWFNAATASSVSAVSEYSSEPQHLDAAYGTTAAPDGTHFVALDGDSSVRGALQQTIAGLEVGQKYQLSFSWAAVQLSNRTGATTDSLQFNLGTGSAQNTTTYDLPSQGFSGWMTGGGIFTATAASETLSFLSIGTPNGLPPIVLLDNVSLTAVPEPSSLALSCLGVLGMGSLYLRRRLRRQVAG